MSDKNETASNTSGHGKMAEIPEEIEGWSWGAFLLTWIWGIGNNTYRAFWCWVPIVNIIMSISLGLKGREWAWRNRRWQSVEHFNRAQKRWSIAGLIVMLVSIVLFAIVYLIAIFTLNHAIPTKMAIDYAQQSSQFQQVLGTSIKRSSNVRGNIFAENGSGQAELAFSIKGSDSNGVLSYSACEKHGLWHLSELTYQDSVDSSKSVQFQPADGAVCNN